MKLILIIGFNQLKEIARWKKYLLKNKKWILKDMNVLENDSINKHTKKIHNILNQNRIWKIKKNHKVYYINKNLMKHKKKLIKIYHLNLKKFIIL